MSEVPEEVKDAVAEVLRVFRGFPYVRLSFKKVEKKDSRCRIVGEYECFDFSNTERGSFEAELNLGERLEVVRFVVG
jgi:hypothetical protein